MEFKEELPFWGSEGVKPPKTKLEEGWNVGDKPPAEWFNWIQSRTYKSLLELRENSSELHKILGEKADEEDVKEMIDNVPEVFHDAPQNSVTEDLAPVDFEHGITICSQSNTGSFPTIKEYGVTLTARGVYASYAQIFITRHGDVWARRSGVIDSWNGNWYNAKKELDRKADKSYVDEKIGDIDFTELEEKIDKKADKTFVTAGLDKKTDVGHKHSANDITETYNRNFVSMDEKLKIQDIDDKADKDAVARTSTIVLANYDSHENSKKGADIVINEGENASEKINEVIQSLKDTGGEIKLMEGAYRINSKISILSNNITIKGVGRGTILKVDRLPVGTRGSIVEVGEDQNDEENQVYNFKISDIIIDGNNTEEKYHGITLWSATNCYISNVECSGNGSNGIQLFNNSSATISNVKCNNNEENGIALFGSSSATISNVKCYDNNWYGISLSNNSSATISNVKCNNNEENGIALFGSSSATISNVKCSDNISGGILISSSSQEIKINNATLRDNCPNPQYLNDGQLNLGFHAQQNASNIFATSCKIIDTKGNTRGVVIRGDNHALTNTQFVGTFKEKIKDDGKDTQLIGNVGV